MKGRVFSGARPTGRQHLGNYCGAIQNYVALQEEYECVYCVVDLHALTTEYEEHLNVKEMVLEVAFDYLACGLDPQECTIFVQSRVPEHAELSLLLSMITPLGWLERNPTYKDQIAQISSKDLSTFGFLGYPVLQAADIIMYKPFGVPVGIDQVPHVEITREISRRFNYLYGDVFPEPEALLTQTPKILGIDRRKMSKSYDNAIYLSDSPDVISHKVSGMITDPQRARKNDPGNPDVCNVFDFHKIYTENKIIDQIDKECRVADIGCVKCKKIMAQNLIKALEPVREKRDYFLSRPKIVNDIIEDGIQKARNVARQTMEEVRAAVKI